VCRENRVFSGEFQVRRLIWNYDSIFQNRNWGILTEDEERRVLCKNETVIEDSSEMRLNFRPTNTEREKNGQNGPLSLKKFL